MNVVPPSDRDPRLNYVMPDLSLIHAHRPAPKPFHVTPPEKTNKSKEALNRDEGEKKQKKKRPFEQ